MNNFSKICRIFHKSKAKLIGKGLVFIGDIDYYADPVEIKNNIVTDTDN